MANNILVDAGFLVALLNRRDAHHKWATEVAHRFPPPWHTCEAALSEAFFLLGKAGSPALCSLLKRNSVMIAFELPAQMERILKLIQKYADVPMSLADACLVRMTELLAGPILLTTDSDFRIYRRHSRQVVPCNLPG